MSGTIKEVKLIEGDYAVGGTITYNSTTKKYDIFCDTPGWQSIETRGCVILETEKYGYVALLPIGMMPVTSINWENNIKVGTKVKKGDMLGYFLFGGSDFVILFKKGVNFELTASPEGNGYKHLLMGEELGELTLKE